MSRSMRFWGRVWGRLVCCAVIFCWGSGEMPVFAQKKKLNLEAIFKSSRFQGKTVADVQWLPDSSAFTFTRDNGAGARDIYRHDVASGEERMILAGGALRHEGKPVTMTAYQTTGRQTHLLISGARRQIWRHSFAAPYYLYNVETEELTPLAKGDPDLQNVALSPGGKRVAYAKTGDLYVAEVASGESKRLTRDGSFNILNGVFDWVYEEEFGRADALRWSPDGTRIAFWRTDQTRVQSFPLLDEMGRYAKVTSLKYPKVGQPNAIVRIGVVDVRSGATIWMELGENDDIYVPRIEWTNRPGILAIQRLNREQNFLELLFADSATGKTRVILSDRDSAWVDVTDDWIFLAAEERILWTSEASGFRHIYLSDYEAAKLAQLTRGSWEVTSVIGVDEEGGWVYFYGKRESCSEKQVYRVTLAGGKLERVSRLSGWHDAVFSPDYHYFVDYASNVRTPTRVDLRRADGKLVRTLEENAIEALNAHQMVYPEFFTMKTTDGVELSAYMVKPKAFDAAGKYPVIVFGYGGPGSQMVVNRWGMGGRFYHLQRTLWHQLMTEKGYLVFCVDNRGTGGKGKAFKNLAHGDLSKWAVHDQIEAAKYLAGLPYVDASRIGFWGWSGGGYLACMLMMRAGDYFSTGIAVAPVSDFRNYDTIWTERYMGLLPKNREGYRAANVLEYSQGLKGRLLLVHGTGDDNVHPQNTMQLVEHLIAAGKQFDLMLYPNRNHRISGGNTSHHLYRMITHYFEEHL